jgi:norsolorinic acid ketoreductase
MEILKLYLARPRTTVISAVRDVHHSSAQDLHKLPIAAESRLIVVKIDSASLTDAQDAVQELQSKFGVTRLDTVIANAGIGRNWVSVADTTAAQVEDHISINAIGPLTLFHAVRPLLFESPTPRFVVLSSELGSLGMQKDRKIPDVAYGMSKAAVNFFVGKLHHEVPNLIAFPIHPGSVRHRGLYMRPKN